MNPVTDVVVMLLETPFQRWKSGSKNDLLKVGRPIPILSILTPDKNKVRCFVGHLIQIYINNTLGYVEVIILYKNCFVGLVC